MIKQSIITSVIALSLLAAMPAWGQTTVIKRTETKQNATPSKAESRWKWKGDYSEGLAAVEDNTGKRGYIDKSGNLVIPCKWKNAWNFTEGMARVTDENNKHGYIDKTGKVVIPYTYQSVEDFSDGHAWVTNKSYHDTYINKNGEVIYKR